MYLSVSLSLMLNRNEKVELTPNPRLDSNKSLNRKIHFFVAYLAI